jgi:hypothetical protein
VKASVCGTDLRYDSWQQQLQDAICVTFAGKVAQQVSGDGSSTDQHRFSAFAIVGKN